MSFVPANQNWWCNGCLAASEGEAPAGLKAPTADQVAEQRHADGHASVAATGSASSAAAWAITDMLFALPLLALLGGVLLIYSGLVLLGSLLIGAVLLSWVIMG